VLWLAAIALTLYGTFLALRALKSTPPHLDAPFGLYPVSILKPLKGIDNGIRENLVTFFELDYPEFELLFSVSDANDPARALVEELMAHYPSVNARLVVGQVDAGPNPKVNNLIRTYESAAHDLVLISDSNVRVEPAYLKRLVAHLDNGVGMITAVVAGRNPATLGGRLEAMYLNTFYARGMYLAEAFGQPCVVGKSMLFSRKTAERFGGIKSLARYLAEDYMAGVAMRRLGLKVILMSDPVPQHIGKYAAKEFWHRHLRWGRIRKSQAPLAFIVEPLSGSLVSAALGAWGVHALTGLAPSTFLALHLAIWSACDLLIARQLERGLSVSMPLTWLLREALAIPLWLHTALGNTVLWRGRKLALQPGGLLENN
jgi:ceramide glucosyltransferase